MRALTFKSRIHQKNRLTIPIANINEICRQLGVPTFQKYYIVCEIKSIQSSDGIEFLDQ